MTSGDKLEVALARVEAKLDHLLTRQDAIGAQVDSVEERLRVVEQDTASLKNQSAHRLAWPAVVSALAAVAAIVYVVAEQMFAR